MNIIIFMYMFSTQRTAKGSACFQEMDVPQADRLAASGRLSGTMNTMNMMLNIVIMVAMMTTCVKPLA